MEKEQERVTVVTFKRTPHDDLWVEGNAQDFIGEKSVWFPKYFEAKVYNEGSKYGVNNGRVSKLMVWEIGFSGEKYISINYDRGWDRYPEHETNRQLLVKILECLEGMEKYEE